MPIKDKTGQKFGRLTVVSLSHTGARGVAFWNCSCECGGGIVVGGNLGRGTNSCGCIRKELNATYYVTHGLSGTDTHRIWKGIVSRCTIPSATGYARYGAKGISLCDRWRDSYESFLADMGERPSKDHSVDRIDNTKGYSPENCRWATRGVQNRNTSANRNVTVDGVTKCVAEWAEAIGVDESLIRQRMDRGWSADAAVKTPKNSTDRGLLSGTSKTITANGETHTISGWAKRLGVTTATISGRLALGWSIHDALTVIDKIPETITVDGESLTIHEWCARVGITYASLRYRLQHGWSSRGAVTTARGGKKC